MNLYINQAELRIQSALPLYQKTRDAIGIHILLSKMNISSNRGDVYSIIVNIIRDHFKSAIGDIYSFKNGDIIIVYRGRSDKLIKDCLHQVYYLFSEDNTQLPPIEDFINKFSQIFYSKDWSNFILLCNDIINSAASNEKINYIRNSLISEFSDKIEEALNPINWTELIKTSPIAKHSYEKMPIVVFQEIYADIDNITYIIGENFDIVTNTYLRSYFKEFLDLKLLVKLVDLLSTDLEDNVYLLNLNITTVATEEFWELASSLTDNVKKKIIIAITIGDVYSDITHFLEIREKIVEHEFKLCLDGLDYLSFMQIDRESLGFDLLRIKQKELFEVAKLSELEQALKAKITTSGASRIILEVEHESCISDGKKLGIMLYQISRNASNYGG